MQFYKFMNSQRFINDVTFCRIEGRGKFVVCEVVIFSKVVKNVFKIFVFVFVDFNVNKNLIGLAMVGSIGGFNVYVVNVVLVIFIVIGQVSFQ